MVSQGGMAGWGSLTTFRRRRFGGKSGVNSQLSAHRPRSDWRREKENQKVDQKVASSTKVNSRGSWEVDSRSQSLSGS